MRGIELLIDLVHASITFACSGKAKHGLVQPFQSITNRPTVIIIRKILVTQFLIFIYLNPISIVKIYAQQKKY